MTGYNSYGPSLRPLPEIWESEKEKGNRHVLKMIRKAFPSKKDRESAKAIWIEKSAVTCFKRYCLDAEWFYADDDAVIKAFPDYMDSVSPVELDGLACIIDDPDIGCLYVKTA